MYYLQMLLQEENLCCLLKIMIANYAELWTEMRSSGVDLVAMFVLCTEIVQEGKRWSNDGGVWAVQHAHEPWQSIP